MVYLPIIMRLLTKDINTNHGNATYYWDGRFHLVPRDFDFPKAPLRVLFQYWILGDRRQGLPPFKSLQANDLTGDPRKRLPDVKYAMNKIESLCRSKNIWIPEPTASQINHMFDQIRYDLGISGATDQNRQRRVEQLAWTTAQKIMRKSARASINR